MKRVEREQLKQANLKVSESRRSELIEAYTNTSFFFEGHFTNGGWLPVTHARGNVALISAYNPNAMLASSRQNIARDRKLFDWLAGDYFPLRAKGQSGDGSYVELGWLVAFHPNDLSHLLDIAIHYQQVAIHTVEWMDRYIVWTSDGSRTVLPQV